MTKSFNMSSEAVLGGLCVAKVRGSCEEPIRIS